ncbi:MAG: type I-B CRISPR-associated protein Cas7/Cst2/DevR, partial [Spirochaetes bacterium]|nr:type I-B CRISPR-associated protein Cas7/Cst2/DevR [Spirochaetota bacterium]
FEIKKFEQLNNIKEKIIAIYEELSSENKNLIEKIKNDIDDLLPKVENIELKNGKIIIDLKKEEKKKRLSELLFAMGELGRQIEGSERNLTPYFAIFSLDYATPKYLLFVKDMLKHDKIISEEKLNTYAKKDNKN